MREDKISADDLIEMYKTKGTKEIGEILGVHATTVMRWLHRLGVKMRINGANETTRSIRRAGPFVEKARTLGMVPNRYIRLLAVKTLGGKCCVCGISDLRVLQINHINGEGVELYSSGRRKPVVTNHRLVSMLAGETHDHLEVRCCNCNYLHEYERGNISPIPEELMKSI